MAHNPVNLPKTAWILLLDAALLLILIFAGPLATWMIRRIPTCPLAALGYLCPACGSTRCILALSQLRIAQAFSFHPLLCILLVYCLLGWIALHLGHLGKRPLFRKLFAILTDYRAIIAWAIAYVLFAILRNI